MKKSIGMIFPDTYSFDFKRPELDGDLVVTVSSSGAFAFYMSDFRRATLYIGDSGFSYYTRKPDVLAAGITALMRERGHERAVFLGHSKGGFGALLLTKLCASMEPNKTFGAIVFSPQVRLWPRNTSLSFPSYKRLMDAAKADPILMASLIEFGLLSPFDEPNLFVSAHCGRASDEDRGELDLLLGRRVSKSYSATSSHMSHLPHVVDTTDADALRKVLDRAYSQNAKIEGELPSVIADRTFDEMSKLPKQKHIIELVQGVFDNQRPVV